MFLAVLLKSHIQCVFDSVSIAAAGGTAAATPMSTGLSTSPSRKRRRVGNSDSGSEGVEVKAGETDECMGRLRADVEYRKALLIQAHIVRAQAFQLAGDLEKAVESLHNAHEQRPSGLDEAYNLTLAFWRVKQKHSACMVWLEFRGIPNDRAAIFYNHLLASLHESPADKQAEHLHTIDRSVFKFWAEQMQNAKFRKEHLAMAASEEHLTMSKKPRVTSKLPLTKRPRSSTPSKKKKIQKKRRVTHMRV